MVRGCDPQPGAFTFFRGKKVRLYDTRMGAANVERPAGEVTAIVETGVEVVSRGGVLKIGKLRLEKGEKVGTIEFARLVDMKLGDHFGV